MGQALEKRAAPCAPCQYFNAGELINASKEDIPEPRARVFGEVHIIVLRARGVGALLTLRTVSLCRLPNRALLTELGTGTPCQCFRFVYMRQTNER